MQVVYSGLGEGPMSIPASAPPRNGPRIHVDLPVRLRFGWKWSEEIGASAVDISSQGMRVRCRAPLRLGLDVEAILAGAPDGPKFYRVVWVRDHAVLLWNAAALIGGRVHVSGLRREGGLQGDIRFLDVLEAMGCTVRDEGDGTTILGTPLKFTANGDLAGAAFHIFKIVNGKYVTVK